MPLYDFHNEKTGETISVFLDMKQAPEAYRQQTVNGVVYKRVYTVPHACKDTKVGSAARDDFRRVTEGKNLTVGEMQNISREMSQIRESKEGVDRVKEKFITNYKKNVGVAPLSELKQQREKRTERIKKAKEKLGKFGVKVDFNP